MKKGFNKKFVSAFAMLGIMGIMFLVPGNTMEACAATDPVISVTNDSGSGFMGLLATAALKKVGNLTTEGFLAQNEILNKTIEMARQAINPAPAPAPAAPVAPAVPTVPTVPTVPSTPADPSAAPAVQAPVEAPAAPNPEAVPTAGLPSAPVDAALPADAAMAQTSAVPSALPGYGISGSCVTDFSTSSDNRKTNIAVAASKFANLIVNPGQQISVSTLFTRRTTANGYKTAGAYSGGKTVQAVGGGICQVSSTIYVAAMNAGLTIVQRFPHSMAVPYLPLGMDAAIAEGSKDLIIRNDYPFPVVFNAAIAGNNLIVNVLTDKTKSDGRTFRFYAVPTGSLSAESYLETSINGQVVSNALVAKSKYNPHR